MAYQRTRKPSSQHLPSQEPGAQFASRPFAPEAQPPVLGPRTTYHPNLLGILTRPAQPAPMADIPASVPSTPIQQHRDAPNDAPTASVEPPANTTSLPDGLQAAVEHLSGYSLSDVTVQYDSPKPAQFQALAYAQGSAIHVAPGQEHHLPHEAWHIVQQAQGRVRPTMQLKEGIAVNDDTGLEHEADAMGARALAMATPLHGTSAEQNRLQSLPQSTRPSVQRVIDSREQPQLVEYVKNKADKYELDINNQRVQHILVHAVKDHDLLHMAVPYVDTQFQQVMAAKQIQLKLLQLSEECMILLKQDKQTDALKHLLDFQVQMEMWKTADPEGVVIDAKKWDELTSWSTKEIQRITNTAVTSLKETSPQQLAEAKQALLTSMAIRITASNSRQYHSSESEQRVDGEGTYVDFAYDRQVNKSRVDTLRGDKELTPIAPLMKGNTKKTVEKNAAVVEKNLEAVCTEFAQLAAVALDGHGVRVEIIGSMNTNHNWVLLGRPTNSELTNPKTWGEDVVIVDCWWGAMYWESYGEMPKVLYKPWEHTGEYGNKPDASYWDSAATQEVNAGGGLEEDFSFANAKKMLSGFFNKNK